MKRITCLLSTFAFFALSVLISSDILAQTITIEGSGTSSSHLYNPLYTWNAAPRSQRAALIYPSSLLTGMQSGSVITSLSLHRQNDGISMPAGASLKIYLVNSAVDNYGSSALDWSTAITGGVLVYEGDPSSIIGSTSGYKEFVFNTGNTFTYTGNHLAVVSEYIHTTAPSTTIGWTYQTSSTQSAYVANSAKYTNNSTTTPPTSMTTSQSNHANIKFNYISAAACTSPPTAGTASASLTTICATSSTTLNLDGYSSGSGQTFAWQSSSNNVDFTDVVTGLTSPGYIASPTTTTYYRAAVTCSGSTTYSTSVLVNVTPQLSGTYTINPAMPTSGTNFQTFADVNSGLACGVSTNVIFQIPAGSVFTGPLEFTVTGSSTASISFVKTGTGANPLIRAAGTSATTDYVLRLSGVDYYSFDGIDIGQTGTSSTDWVEYGILLQNSTATNGTRNNTFKNGIVSLSNGNTGAYGVFVNASPTPTSNEGTNSGNRFYNMTIQNCFQGYRFDGASSTYMDDGNEVNTLSGGTSEVKNLGNGTLAASMYGVYAVYQKNLKIANTTISNLTNGGTSLVYGITAQTSANNTIEVSNCTLNGISGGGTNYGIYVSTGASVVAKNNTITNISTSGAASSVRGIYITATGVIAEISGNKIHGISSTGTTTTSAAGIDVGTGTHTIFNNMIWNIRASSSTNTDAGVRGISITGGTASATHKIYYNTVYLSDVSTSASHTSAALHNSSTTPTLDIRNNIFVNDCDITIGTRAAAFKRTSTTSNIASTSNNNIYYAGVPSTQRLIYHDGTNAEQTLAGYKTRVAPADANSLTEMPPFVNVASAPFDIHITPNVSTQANDNATPISGYTVDFDGDLRHASMPDIGADEFDGTLSITNDISAQEFINPVSGSFKALSFDPQVSFKNEGSQSQSSVTVRFRILASPGGTEVYNQTANISSIASGASTTVTFPTANLSEGAFTMQATVEHAGDQVSGNNTISGSFTASGPIAGTFSIGASQAEPFNTLTSAIDFLSTVGASGAVVFSLVDNTYSSNETFPITIPAVDGLSSINTFTIRPASGVAATITGSSNTSVIRLNGADYVIIDGLKTGGASLSIENTSTSAGSSVIWLSSVAAGNGASNNKIKNLNIKAGAQQNTTTTVTYGIIVAGPTLATSVTSVAAGADNDNNEITGNTITKVRYAIVSRGFSSSNPNLGNVISDNIIGPSAFGTEAIGKAGILVREEDGVLISGNEIRYIGGDYDNLATGSDKGGVVLATEATWTPSSVFVKNAVITRNSIHHIVDERAFSAVGIIIGGTDGSNATSNLVSNNFIYHVKANGTSDQAVGIGLSFGNGDKVVFNSIYLTGDTDPNSAATTPTGQNYGLTISSASVANPVIRNNAVYMDLTSSSAPTIKSAAINIPASFDWGTGGSNYNNFYVSGSNSQANIGCIGGSTTAASGTMYATLAAWKAAATGQDVNSITADPLFLSASDLHVQNTSPHHSTGLPVAGVTVDFDGSLRDGETPDIGADEFTPPCSTPSAQPTVLQLNPTASGSDIIIEGSFTATTNASNKYLVIRTPDNVAPSPVNGTSYTVGNVPGLGYVELSGRGNDFVSSGLAGSTPYYFWVFAFDGSCSGGPLYNLSSPLTGNATTSNPCVSPAAQPTGFSATVVSTTTMNISFTAATPAPTEYLVVRTTSSTAPSPGPQNGVEYTVGQSALGGYIESVSNNTSFTSSNLTGGTTYYYYIYSYNHTGCSGGPNYLTTAPLTGSSTTYACPTPGTYAVGPTGHYPSLTTVLNVFANCTATGAYVFELQSNYSSSVETFPLAVSGLSGLSSTNTITVRPAANATDLVISSAHANGTVLLSGANWIIIDGRPGGTGTNRHLSITNTNTSAPAISFINDASNNTLRYLNVRSVNSSTTSGTIVFGGTTATTGNDNNTVANCFVYEATVNATPTNAIYSVGTASKGNTGNTISNNRIYNYFNAASATNGILLGAENSDWTISGNSFYQTTSRTFTTSAVHNAISINNTSGNGFVVTNNYIGGADATAGGTAYTLSGVSTRFVGINLAVGTTTATSVQGNIIRNFNITSAYTTTTLPAIWTGIYLSSGNANIGNVSGNTIGSTTGTGSIQVTASGSITLSTFGIASASAGVVNISNNSIGSITVSGSSAGISCGVAGIQTTAGTTVTISGNTVGSTTTANSINAAVPSTSTTAQRVVGIENTSTATISITNNTVANLNNNYNSTGASSMRGILSSAGVGTVTGNTIYNLINAGTSTSTLTSAPTIGLQYNSTTAGNHTVSRNTVHSVSGTAVSATVHLYGIYYAGPTAGTNLVSRNLVHSLNLTTSSTSASLRGIMVNAGLTTFQNNMVRVGVDADGLSVANGFTVHGISDAGGVNNYYFNSVYVGGAGVASSTTNTFAFLGATTTGERANRNNIYVNARSNTSGTAKHYAISISSTLTGLTINNNLYSATGTGGVLGFLTSDRTTIEQWRTATSQDAASISGSPQFINATGNAATVDLHIHATNPTPIEQAGVAIDGITDDYDGQSRAGLTPTDIGADAGNFEMPVATDIQALALVTPAAGSSLVAGNTANFTPQASFTNSGTAAQTNVPVRFRILGPTNAVVYNETASIPSMAASGTTIATFPSASLTTSGTYTIQVIAELPGDQISANNQIERTITVIGPMSGTYIVGASQPEPFNTLTNAIERLTFVGVAGPVTLQLSDNAYSNAEVFPIRITAINGTNAVNRVTIKPASGVNCTISGSSGGAGTALLKLEGADFVTLDGINSGGSSLTIENTSATSGTAVIWLSSLNTNQGATNNEIKNCHIKGGITTNTSTSVSYGLVVAGSTLSATIGSVTAGADNDNNLVSGNTFSKLRYGIYFRGGAAPNFNLGNVITNNIVGPASFGTESIGRCGMLIREEDGIVISNNEIRFVGGDYANTSATADRGGIVLATDAIWNTTTSVVVKNAIITGNKIHDIIEERGSSAVGIIVGTADGSSATNNLIANNMIYNIKANGSADQAVGIGLAFGNGNRVVYNSIYLTGDTDPNSSAAAPTSSNVGISIYSASVTNPVINNNIVYMDLSSSSAPTLRHAAINIPASYSWGTGGSNYNDLFVSGSNARANIGSVGALATAGSGTFYATLNDWKTVSQQDANSISEDPLFISSTDLHVRNTSPVNALATPVAAVTTDIDGAVRDASKPDIGADEIIPPMCSVVEGGTINASSANYCEGANTATTFVVTGSTTAGRELNFQWQLSTGSATQGFTNISGARTTTFTTPANLPPGTYYYRYRVVCMNNYETGYSNVAVVTVTPMLPPTVAITATATSIMPGTSVTFTANAKNGGSAPVYQWKLNGLNVGSNAKTLIVDTLEDLDKISVHVTSNATCRTADVAISNIITIRSGFEGLSQTITFPAIPVKTVFDAPFNPGATASSGLDVTYYSSNLSVAKVVAGNLVEIVGPGTATITAKQPGNANFNPAPEYSRVLEVLPKLAQTISFNISGTKTLGDADFNLSASATSGLPVTFVSLNPAIATVTPQGLVHIRSAGSVKIAAQQAGDTTYYPAPQVIRTLVIGGTSQTITFPAFTSNMTVGDAALDPGASASSGLPITYTSSNSGIVAVTSSGKLVAKRAGTVTIKANQPGNASYFAASPVSRELVVEKADQVITISPIAPQQTLGTYFRMSATSSAGFSVSTFISSNTSIAEVRPGRWIKARREGTVTITAYHAGNHSYKPATATVVIQVVAGTGRAADSTSIVSNIMPVPQVNTSTSHLVLFPNPVQKDATLSYKAEKTGKVTITITDPNGRRVQIREEQVFAGMNNIRIHSAALRQGTYYIQVIEGDKVSQVKLLKIE